MSTQEGASVLFSIVVAAILGVGSSRVHVDRLVWVLTSWAESY
jgi:hypothetical protein